MRAAARGHVSQYPNKLAQNKERYTKVSQY